MPFEENTNHLLGEIRMVDPVFVEIYQRNLWGQAGSSGPGSGHSYTDRYRRFLFEFMGSNQIDSVLDFGCGDWQFSRSIDWGHREYLGVDVVPALIELHRSRYETDYIKFDFLDWERLRSYRFDLVIVKDVFQHLSNQDILVWLGRLRSIAWHCFWINDQSLDPEKNNLEISRGLIRPLDLAKIPFNVEGLEIGVFPNSCPWNGLWRKVLMWTQEG